MSAGSNQATNCSDVMPWCSEKELGLKGHSTRYAPRNQGNRDTKVGLPGHKFKQVYRKRTEDTYAAKGQMKNLDIFQES